jgi:hypothetical protein
VEIILKIGADPTRWLTEGADFGAMAAELDQSGPVTVAVAGPLQGTLVLSVPRAGTVALVPPMPGEGSHPSDKPPPVQPHVPVSPQAQVPQGPALYLPTVTGAAQIPGYALPSDTDLGALQQGIITAMTDGSTLTVPLGMSVASPGGMVMLNGASLAFVVICPAAGQG